MNNVIEIICPCCGKKILIESVVINTEDSHDTIPTVTPPHYEFGEQRGGETYER